MRANLETGEKQCSRCKEVKTLLDYYYDTSQPDGLRPYCKPCDQKRRKQYKNVRNPYVKRRHNIHHEECCRQWRLFRKSVKDMRIKYCSYCGKYLAAPKNILPPAKGHAWKPQEDRILINGHDILSGKQLQELLPHREIHAIRQRIRFLKLNKLIETDTEE